MLDVRIMKVLLIVGARWANLSISETAHTEEFLEFTQNETHDEKQKTMGELQLCEWKHLIIREVRGQLGSVGLGQAHPN